MRRPSLFTSEIENTANLSYEKYDCFGGVDFIFAAIKSPDEGFA